MSESPQMPVLSRQNILVGMAVTAIVLLCIAEAWKYLGKVSIVTLGLSLENLALGVGIGGLIALLSSIVYRIWPAYRESADTYLEMVLRPLEMSDLIWLGLLPGMSEELLFRGVALPGLGMNIAAVVITSVVFGGLHLASAKHWPYIIWATIIGLILGFLTLYTGNLFPAIAAHVFTNSFSGLLWKLKQQQLPN